LNWSKLLDTNRSPNGIATSSEQMLLTDECPEALLGFDFSELESSQNLP